MKYLFSTTKRKKNKGNTEKKKKEGNTGNAGKIRKH